MAALVDRLPPVRGQVRENALLSKSTWFAVGGPADVLFKPADVDDLSHFLKHKPADVPVMVLGVGSNLLVRDGGIRGVVIRLGRGFTDIETNGQKISAGAGALDLNVALACQKAGIGGLEFLSGIPGTIGGAVFMNAGAYGREVKDVLVEAEVVMPDGTLTTLPAAACGFSYRHSTLPEGAIVVRATFQGVADDKDAIAAKIAAIKKEREESQPTKARTGGSTFKNPDGYKASHLKAWQLIEKAGGRGLELDGAKISDKHCNFMINTGTASAASLEKLGETVRQRVKEETGVDLEWEIKRVGESA